MKWNIRILCKVLCLSLLQWALSFADLFRIARFLLFYSTSFMKPDDFCFFFSTCSQTHFWDHLFWRTQQTNKQNIKNQTALMAWTLGRMMRRCPTAPVKPSITGRLSPSNTPSSNAPGRGPHRTERYPGSVAERRGAQTGVAPWHGGRETQAADGNRKFEKFCVIGLPSWRLTNVT